MVSVIIGYETGYFQIKRFGLAPGGLGDVDERVGQTYLH